MYNMSDNLRTWLLHHLRLLPDEVAQMSESEMQWAKTGFIAGRASARHLEPPPPPPTRPEESPLWPSLFARKVAGQKGEEIMAILTTEPMTINELLIKLHPDDPTPGRRDYINKVLKEATAAGALEFHGTRPRRFFKRSNK